MQRKQVMKWVVLLVLLVSMSVAAIPGTADEPQGTEPSAISCGDVANCTLPGPAVEVINQGAGAAIRGRSVSARIGVLGIGQPGVRGKSGNGIGVEANSTNSYALRATSANSHAIYVPSAGGNGVDVAGAMGNAIKVYSAGLDGVHVYSAGHNGVQVVSANWSGVYVNSSGADAIRVQTAGQDGLRFFQGMGRDYIRAGSDADLDFRVLNNGEARSDVGFNTPAADFAEMMDVEGSKTDYEPGDVLVVSDTQDRAVELSSASYSRAVIGVYSTKPGFVGGQPVSDEEPVADIPVALMGIVPCKASAENGAIGRGDLLVTSSTPGHAMRADEPPPGTILGKALEPLDEGTGVILVMVTLQ